MVQSVKDINEAKAVLKEHKAEVVDQYRVSEIGIFGSFVHGEQKKTSDIDILVDFSEIPDLSKFIELERYLRKLTGEPSLFMKIHNVSL
jgi:predicted nucleotidyltransferase